MEKERETNKQTERHNTHRQADKKTGRVREGGMEKERRR